MKNITVSVSEDIYHRARVRAAELHSSVSAMVARFLEDAAAAIIEAARLSGCEIVLSEDLNPGKNFDGVRVQNPFA